MFCWLMHAHIETHAILESNSGGGQTLLGFARHHIPPAPTSKSCMTPGTLLQCVRWLSCSASHHYSGLKATTQNNYYPHNYYRYDCFDLWKVTTINSTAHISQFKALAFIAHKWNVTGNSSPWNSLLNAQQTRTLLLGMCNEQLFLALAYLVLVHCRQSLHKLFYKLYIYTRQLPTQQINSITWFSEHDEGCRVSQRTHLSSAHLGWLAFSRVVKIQYL